MERLWRDCRLARIGGGTDEVLADLVASWLDRRDPDFENLVDGYLAADLPGQDRSGSRMTAEAMAMARIHSITQ
jgi:citronellyl-CoA dehydrogenase